MLYIDLNVHVKCNYHIYLSAYETKNSIMVSLERTLKMIVERTAFTVFISFVIYEILR